MAFCLHGCRFVTCFLRFQVIFSHFLMEGTGGGQDLKFAGMALLCRLHPFYKLGFLSLCFKKLEDLKQFENQYFPTSQTWG